MAGPKPKEVMTFAPEPVGFSTPQERAQRSHKLMEETGTHLEEASKGFSIAKFTKDFAEPLMNAYNARAKQRGLPLATKEWFEIFGQLESSKSGLGQIKPPRAFLIANRNTLQKQLFPNNPKAAEAYDVLIDLANLPQISSLPVSGVLGHEFGHSETAYQDPKTQVKSYGPKGGKRPDLEHVVNEAVASFRGFQMAWKTWSRFGIPRKAWGTWVGFPQYANTLGVERLPELIAKLKTMESAYPGISSQAYKVVYHYDDYVKPVMYNVPGKDWTPKERLALKRFLESRGGVYRDTLPEDADEQLKHMRSQPYVKAPTTTPTSAVADFLPPLSKRAWPPLSCR
jgi:hypothetical protein